MKTKPTGWTYRVEDDDTDPQDVCVYDWQNPILLDAQHAAELAAENEWDNCDGWERGIEAEPIFIITDLDGNETRWTIRREPQIHHYATEVGE